MGEFLWHCWSKAPSQVYFKCGCNAASSLSVSPPPISLSPSFFPLYISPRLSWLTLLCFSSLFFVVVFYSCVLSFQGLSLILDLVCVTLSLGTGVCLTLYSIYWHNGWIAGVLLHLYWPSVNTCVPSSSVHCKPNAGWPSLRWFTDALCGINVIQLGTM